MQEDDCGMVKVETVELFEDDISLSSSDVRDLCRVCAKPCKHMVSIFGPDGMQQQLQWKITNFLPIQVKEDDILPLQVCASCCKQLEASQVLAQVCAVADITLRNLLLKPDKDAESPKLVSNSNYSDIQYFSELDDLQSRNGSHDDFNSVSSSDVETIDSQAYELKSLSINVPSSDVETIGSQDFQRESNSHAALLALSSDVETIGSQDFQRDSDSHMALFAFSSDVETIGSQDFKIGVRKKKRRKQRTGVYNKQGDLPCTLCDALLLNFMHLKDHYLKFHQMKGCGNCEDVFSNNEDLNLHLQNEHPFLVTCRCCSQSFHSENLLQVHFAAIHPTIKVFLCDLCAKVFETNEQLLHHQFEEHMQTFLCKLCNSAFGSEQILSQHIKKIHKEILKKNRSVDYVCAYCKNTYNSKFSMRKHMLIHIKNASNTKHNVQQLKLDCDSCSKTFLSKKPLKNHMKIHFNIQSANICPICDKTIKTADGLKSHLRYHPSGKWVYECGVCQSTFSSETLTLSHLQSHTCSDIVESKCTTLYKRTSDFFCKECDKYFYNDRSLLEHLKSSHTSINTRFKCSLCPRTFKKRYSLSIHARSHMKVKPYMCNICNKTFSLPRSLANHKRSAHSKERPFLCELCGKSFTSATNIYSHKMYVHKKKSHTYFCSFCNKQYYRIRNLKAHEKTHKGSKK